MPVPAGTEPKRGPPPVCWAVMTNPDSVPDSFADEVPVADAVEQTRPAVDDGEAPAPGDDSAPLESNESDWQEQRMIVEDPEDDFR